MASILGTGLDSAQKAKQQYNVSREKTEGEGKPEKAGGPPPPPSANTDVYTPSAAAVAMSILAEETEEVAAESTEVAEEETLFDYMDSDVPVDEELAELDEFLASIDETVMDEVDGDEVDVDGDDIEVDGDEADVDGDDIEVDGDETDVDGDDIEVDGDEADVDSDESTAVASDENRVHGFVSSITDADLTAMKFAMMSAQMTSFGLSADSIYSQMDEESANKISEWFSDSSSNTEEMDDLLSALENLFPGSTSGTEDDEEDVEVDSDVIDPVEDPEEVETDSDVIDPVEDTVIDED